MKEARTVRSGVKVKMSEACCWAASRNTESQICSRSRTKGSLPKSKTAVTASTVR
jgi:hypothetical protein